MGYPVNVTAAGNTYVTPPTVTVAAPAAQSFNANSAVVANGFISITSNKFQDGDKVTYIVAAGNTAIAEVANNTEYYVETIKIEGKDPWLAIVENLNATSESSQNLAKDLIRSFEAK